MCKKNSEEAIRKANDTINDCLRQPASSSDLRNCLKNVAEILSHSEDDLQETAKTGVTEEEIYTNT
jgi:hypothetical protein